MLDITADFERGVHVYLSSLGVSARGLAGAGAQGGGLCNMGALVSLTCQVFRFAESRRKNALSD